MMRGARAQFRNGEAETGDRTARRWADRQVLFTVGALVVAALIIGQLAGSVWPADGSADVGFARDMTLHHRNAVDMADIVRDRTRNDEVRALASEIALVQQWQIGRVQGWLDLWGVPLGSDRPRMAWMGHADLAESGMPGMATQADLRRLEVLPPNEMDVLFLRLMVPHHQAAIVMAEAALKRADRPEVRELADGIIVAQGLEIGLIQQMLQRRGLPPVPADPPIRVSDKAGHGKGFTASVRTTFRDTVRLAPLLLGLFAAAWFGLDGLRRRRGSPPPRLPAAARTWQMVTVAGLLGSAILHLGLTPAHLDEQFAYGAFFAVATAALVVVAAAVLAWPARPAFLGGVVLASGLLVTYLVFRVVAPPGGDGPEAFDLVGLVTKLTEVVALVGCAVLWRRGGASDAPAGNPLAGARRRGPRPRQRALRAPHV